MYKKKGIKWQIELTALLIAYTHVRWEIEGERKRNRGHQKKATVDQSVVGVAEFCCFYKPYQLPVVF